jgi:hypothetical protein
MKRLLEIISKNDTIVRLCKPPTLHEMMMTGEQYFPLPNEWSRDIMIHLGYYLLYLLIPVNKSFYKLLTRSLENGPCIFGYQHNERIDSEFMERLYGEHEAFLNKHKATYDKRKITLRSMIICSTEWPDINPRKLHLLSLVNPKYPNTLAFQISFCENMTGFYHILSDHLLLPDDPLFQHSTFNTNRISHKVLNWREPISKYKSRSLNLLWSYFDFSLKKDENLQAAVEYLEKTHICINVLPEFSSSTNLPTDLFPESNTLKFGVDQFSVILTIDKCEKLTDL